MDDSLSKTESDVFPDICCRLLLIGKTGCGKSSTGNTILGEDVFQAKAGINSGTKLGKYGTAKRGNLTIEVMDTPGLSDTDNQDLEHAAEIKKSLFSMQPGPHAMLFVVKCCDRFTQDDLRVYNALKKIFGEHLPLYTIVVFTGVETLEGGKKMFKQQLPENKMLSFIINEVSTRYMFFHNKSRNPAKKEKDVTRLIKKVKKLVKHNSTHYFQHTFSQVLEPHLQIMTEEEMIEVQAVRPDKSRDIWKSADDSVTQNTDPSELAHASDHLRESSDDGNNSSSTDHLRESIDDRNNSSNTDLDNQIMGPDGPNILSGDLNQAHAIKTRTYSDEETLSATSQDSIAATPSDSSAAIHPDSSAATPPDSSAATPPDSSAATPPDSSAATPPDSSAATPPDSSAAIHPDSSTAIHQDSSAATPPDSSAATSPDNSAAMHLLSPLKYSPSQKFKPVRKPDFCRNTLISAEEARRAQTTNKDTATDDIKGYEDTTLSTTVDNQTACGVHTNQDKKIIDEDQATDNGQTSNDKTKDNDMTASNIKIGNAKSLNIYSDSDHLRLLSSIRVKDKIVNKPDDLTEVQREEYVRSLSDLEDRIVDGLIEAEVKNKKQCSLM